MSKKHQVAYIFGPMTGIPEHNKPAFVEAQKFLESKGYDVLNPANLPPSLSQAQCMDIDFASVRACDIMFALPGWSESGGALAEVAYAKKLGKQFFSRFNPTMMVTFTPKLFALDS